MFDRVKAEGNCNRNQLVFPGRLVSVMIGMMTLVLVVAFSALPALAQDDMGLCAPLEEGVDVISETKLYLEYNFTDEDLGVHGSFGESGWAELCIVDPDGNIIIAISPTSQLFDLGMDTIFWESREPEFDEFDFDDLTGTFPEGEYSVRATMIDGSRRGGAATFTHDVPVAPVITSPAVVEDEDEAEEAAVFSMEGLVIEWEDVTETVYGDPAEITGYEVIITNEDVEDLNGMAQPIYDVNVAPDRNSLSVPLEFLEPDTVYELEVLALEVSGNQTISVGFFATE